MKIAIYRLKENGEIRRVQKIPEVPQGQKDWAEIAADYNSNGRIDTVEIKELTDLELCLYNRAEIDIRDHKEEIETMQLTLCEIEKSLDWLCNKVKGID